MLQEKKLGTRPWKAHWRQQSIPNCRRKGVHEVVVTWAYSVALVWLVWFVSKRCVNEIIKGLDYQSNHSISKSLIIKGLDNQAQRSIIQSIKTTKKLETHPGPWLILAHLRLRARSGRMMESRKCVTQCAIKLTFSVVMLTILGTSSRDFPRDTRTYLLHQEHHAHSAVHHHLEFNPNLPDEII